MRRRGLGVLDTDDRNQCASSLYDDLSFSGNTLHGGILIFAWALIFSIPNLVRKGVFSYNNPLTIGNQHPC